MAANHLFDGLLGDRRDDRDVMLLADGGSWSYGRLIETSGRLANLMRQRGVGPGDRIAVQVQKSAEAIALYVAAVRLGAVFLPLNIAYTAAEVGYFIDDAEPSLLVVDPARETEHAAGAIPTLTLSGEGGGSLMTSAQAQAVEFDNSVRGAADLAAILYTSGTTGPSKGAMLTHDNLLSNAVSLTEYWAFSGDDRLLHALPIFHTHGLFVATNVIFRCGGAMIFLPRFEVDAVLEQLPRATAMMGVPTFYTRLLANPRFDRRRVAHMRLFVSGSAPMLAETHLAFEARTGHRILERYGMTETNMNTSNPYAGERRVGSVGFPLPGVRLRIADPESGAQLAPGETGMIEVSGPNVFPGYWRKPEKTAEEFRADGFFVTGDLGLIDADGYVHIVGRARDLIISGGYNVYPKQIETEIDALDGVVESAVFGIADADLGEIVAAAVVCAVGVTPDADRLLAELRPLLARFKLPRRIVFVDQLPRNTMGKVQKNRLRETFG